MTLAGERKLIDPMERNGSRLIQGLYTQLGARYGLNRWFPWPFASDASPRAGEIGAVIRSWMEANLWTARQTVSLAHQLNPRCLALSHQELDSLLQGKPIDPSSALFKGMAAIHAAISSRAQERLREPGDLSSHDSMVLTASTLTRDDRASHASWWFAVYCQEPECLQGIVIPSDYSRPDRLSPRLSTYLRRQMIMRGLDPVADGTALLQQAFQTRGVTYSTMQAWLLGLRELNPDDLHASAHRVTLMVNSLNDRVTTVHQLMEELRQIGP